MIKTLSSFLLSALALFITVNSYGQAVYSGSVTLNGPQNITLDVFVDPTADTVQIIHSGPINKWRGIGFGASSMPNTYAIITDGNGSIEERKLAGNASGTVLTNSLLSSSHSVSGTIATTTLTRSLSGLTADHFTFAGGAATISIIWAYGNGVSLAYHAGRGASTITLTQDCTNGITTNTINPVVCSTYTSNSGITYDSTGLYVETFTNAIGCDSLLTIDLTINNSFDSIQVSACGEYTAPSGALYSVSGNYNDTIANAAGCDSIIAIELAILNTESTIDIIGCGTSVFSSSGNQTWTMPGIYTDTIPNAAGCDSIITINLTFGQPSTLDLTITACDEYTSASGFTYTVSGLYTETFLNASGCDSTVNLDLTIVDLDSTVNITFNDPNFPNHIGEVLTAHQAGVSYQWIDCNNNNTGISGEVNQSFAPANPGSYAVVVSDGNCSDTSACQTVTLLSVTENSLAAVRVFPNPSEGLVSVALLKGSDVTAIQIFTITGQLVQSMKVNNETLLSFNLPNEQGVYFAKLISNSGLVRTVKLMKL